LGRVPDDVETRREAAKAISMTRSLPPFRAR